MRCAESGAALVVALLLLLIVSLLAVATMGTSMAELAMAGHEQFRRQASDAASAGIERAVSRVAANPTYRGTGALSAGLAEGGDIGRGEYVTTIRFAGEQRNVPGWNAEMFVGTHFEVESIGRSARRAVDEQIQGLMVVLPANGISHHQRLAGGLPGATP